MTDPGPDLCPRCAAAVDSARHHDTCVVTGHALDGEPAPADSLPAAWRWCPVCGADKDRHAPACPVPAGLATIGGN